ncbi:hypothetical protein CC78DRAFT_67297 [Lojkania enalia]|uniref:Uncharacterized protein n=1 Tax=Lojkania enalia TaxID=147567 RepID=A0A9P4JZU7_9PLEO|nr:hypothetical protein CC78DRAFT_67297 [Didymosphaeria enalia]
MADVRSMLRQERAARQQQAGRSQKQSAAPAAAPVSKKRKAGEYSAEGEGRKRTRTEEASGVPVGFFDEGAAGDDANPNTISKAPTTTQQDEIPQQDVSQIAQSPPDPSFTITPAPPQLDPDAEEDLDAFLKDMAEPSRPTNALSAYSAGAVIESAPMTAAELAAQAREEQSAQRGERERELEAEKEDAARFLEDEFDEMEGLEERVRKLREKREALRKTHAEAKAGHIVLPDPGPVGLEEDEDTESDDEEWDDWRFRPA